MSTRVVGWALAVPLICLMVALSTGVGAFELLAQHEGDSRLAVRIVPSQRPSQLLVQAMRRAEQPAGGGDAAAGRLLAPRPANAQIPEPAQAEALAAVRETFVRVDPPVSARAQELRVAPRALAAGERLDVPVSFYYCEEGPEDFPSGDGGGFCGLMRDGSPVYPGAAACALEYLGQRFRILNDPVDRVYKCGDTGSLIDGQHRDIWFRTNDAGWQWQRSVGPSATIEILP